MFGLNNNLWQSILTALIVLSGFATSVMQYFGCTAVDCAAAPAWVAPYLIVAMPILAFVKLVIGFIEGKLIKPTAVVDDSGLPGTALPEDVEADKTI